MGHLEPVYLGIDPGMTGGLAWLQRGELLYTCPMPAEDKFIDLRKLQLKLTRFDVDHAFLEKVHAMPGQGVSSMFKFGRIYGAIESMLSTLCIPYTLVPPVTWTREIHKGLDHLCETSKEKSALAASMLFPCYDFRKSDRAKKPHMGMVDAALIAEYGRSYAISKIKTSREQGVT